jgi:hypothetical protein
MNTQKKRMDRAAAAVSAGEVKMAVSKKGNRTQTKEGSTELARRREANTATSDKPSAESPKPSDHRVRCQKAFATTDVTLITYLSLQAMSAAGGKLVKDDFASDYSFAAVHSLGARDGLEALLAVQMVGVHSLAMKFLATAALKDQTDYGVESSINRANRLLRTFTASGGGAKKTSQQRRAALHRRTRPCPQWRASRSRRRHGNRSRPGGGE